MTDANETETDLAGLDDLESAEDFLDYFGVAYDPAVIHVNRLHILQRFHDYLARLEMDGEPSHEQYRLHLEKAYGDFVRSDAMTEKVFRVLKRASGISTVQLSAIGRSGGTTKARQ